MTCCSALCCVSFRSRSLLLLKAGAAKDWSALCGLKWDSCFHAALGTRGPGLRTYALRAASALCFALFTVLGVVFELFVVEKHLLAGSEDKLGAAVYALQDSIREFHVARFPEQGRSPKIGQYMDLSPLPVPCRRSCC